MTRSQWSRWGRGSCEGFALRIGSAGPVRFDGSVTRSARRDDGGYTWRSDINGACEKTHSTMADAMTRIEQEPVIARNAFVEDFDGYKAERHKNKYSQAVDASRYVKAEATCPTK